MYNYRLLHDAYFGSGGFADGTYLGMHKRETEKDYNDRRAMAYYLNYFAPIVNALVSPIWKKEPMRDYNGAGEILVKEFLQDVDGNGTDISHFMKNAALKAKVYGVVFIVLDNTEDREPNMEAVIQHRAFPYAYIVTPDEVEDYAMDRRRRLLKFKFRQVEAVNKNGLVTYRRITFTRDSWEITGGEAGRITGKYALGLVPVVPLLSRELEQATLIPEPELEAVAKVEIAIYNHSSWLQEILRNQTFPMLTIPSMDAKDIVIGNNNALGYDPNSTHEPNFIAPSSDPAKVLKDERDSLIVKMYHMASLTYMVESHGQVSGEERKWEFERTNEQLADLAGQCQKAESRMMDIFSRWIGLPINYVVDYPKEFGIADTGAQLTEIQQVIDMGLSDDLAVDLLKRVITLVFPEMPDERFNEIMGDAEKVLNDQKHAGDNGDNGGGG